MSYAPHSSGSAFGEPYSVTPEEQESWLGRGLSAFESLGNALDKPYRSAAQIAAEVRSWFGGPEHDFKASELAAWVPYSDKMGLTDFQNRASGRDILGLHDMDSTAQGVAGFAAEVAFDPLNIVTLGGYGALTKGGKILNRMDILDDVVTESAKRAGRNAAKGTLPKFTKMDTTVGEGLQSYKSSLVKKYGEEATEKIKNIDQDFVSQAQQMGLGNQKLSTLLDEPIGGMFGRNSANPIPGFGRSMWGDSIDVMGTGDLSKAVARAAGKGYHKIKHAPGVRNLRAMFDSSLVKAVSPEGQMMAQTATRAIKKSIEEARLDAVAGIHEMQKLPNYFQAGHALEDGSKLSQHQVSANKILLTKFLENPEMAVPQDLQPLVSVGRDLQSKMRGLMQAARDKGMDIESLQDLEVTAEGFMPRQLFKWGGDGKKMEVAPDPQRILQTTHGSQFQRTGLARDIPGGIAGMQQLSMDPNISGLLHAGGKWKLDKRVTDFDTAVQGFESTTHRGFRPWRSSEFLRRYIRTAETIPTGKQQKITFHIPGDRGDIPIEFNVTGVDPIEKRWSRIERPDGTVGKRTATQKEKDEHLDKVINFLGDLDSRHASEGMPAYIADPIQNYINYTEVMHRAIGAHDQLADAFGDAVIKQGDPRYLPEKYISLGKALENLDIVTRKNKKVSAILDGKHVVRDVQFKEPSLRMVRNILKDKPDFANIAKLDDVELLKFIQNDYLENTLMVPKRLFNDANRMYSAYVSPANMKDLAPFVDFFDKITNAWRAAVTVLFPKFHIRNFAGGQFNNWVIDAWSPGSLLDAQNSMLGNAVSGAGKINWSLDGLPPVIQKQIRKEMAKNGGVVSDELGTRIGLAHIFSQQLWVPDMPAPTMELIEKIGTGNVVDELIKVADAPKTTTGAVSDYLGKLMSEDGSGTWAWTMADVIGNFNLIFPVSPGAIMGRGAFGAKQNVSKLQTLGHKAAAQIEGYNRVAPFWKLIKDGWSPQAAARKIKEAQVDYGRLSEFERKYARRTFSFYTFSRGMIPFVLQRMVERPSGKMMQAVRGIGRVQRDDEFNPWLPEYMRQGSALPIPGTYNHNAFTGKKDISYIQSLGIPPEDTLGMLGFGSDLGAVKGSADNIFTKTHPAAQVLYETITGRDPFYKKDTRSIGYGRKQYGEDTYGVKNHFMNLPALGLIPGFSRGPKIKPGDSWAGWKRAFTKQMLPFSTQDIKDMDRQRKSTMKTVLDEKLKAQTGYYPDTTMRLQGGREGGYYQSLQPGTEEWKMEMVRQWLEGQSR
jgi:hypothetical protein